MNNKETNYLSSNRFVASDIIVNRAKGGVVSTVDNEDYVDFVLGNLTQIMGHRALWPADKVNALMERMINVGDNAHDLIESVSKKILGIAKKDQLRFTNSGSEAAHLAIRVARASTNRNKVLKFVGHYHGWFNEEIGTFLSVPASTGIPESSMENVISVDWNSKEQVQQAFETHGSDIAAIICEPCLAHSGTIPPYEGFLQFLRDISESHGTLLIFDECITGFRLALGGAQELYNVTADLVVYSKAISNGLPFGVLAGTQKSMEPLTSWDVFHASTYDSNPLILLMVSEVIGRLEEGPHYDNLQKNILVLSNGISSICEDNKVEHLIQKTTGFFSLYFTNQERISNYSEAMKTDYSKYKLLTNNLMDRNVIVSEGELSHNVEQRNWIGSWFMSSAHTAEQINSVLARVDTTIKGIF